MNTQADFFSDAPPAQRPRILPSRAAMVEAYLSRDATFDGVFLTAVKTTGIFCHPTCSARKPKPENVEFFANSSDALYAGYRPCKRCHPMDAPGATPPWARELIAAVQAEPGRRWRDHDLRERGIEPERARRWFQAHHGMTFHAFARGLRLGGALRVIGLGNTVTESAMNHGYDSTSAFAEAIRSLTGEPPARGADVATFRRIDTVLGPMIGVAVEAGICLLEFYDRRALESQFNVLRRRFDVSVTPGDHPHLCQLARELDAYFSGHKRSFETPLALRGTAFQEAVWNALLEIPPGQTRSYSEIAHKVGRPGAVRAVGTANGANRIAIVVPCHRVIGADGQLTGYGGGLWRKRKLLEIERSATDPD